MTGVTGAPGVTGLPALGHGLEGVPEQTDVLVVGLGVTGAGVALDAAARGLGVVALEAHDVGFGTSRWSSKLVHGGLRYLARGQLGVAHESAVERGVLMEVTAPHLVRPLPMLLPLTPAVTRGAELMARSGIRAGDLLRLGAGTARETLPRPRRLGATETLALAPGTRRDGLRGSVLSWDGQLEDDVRLVLAVARSAVREGAVVRTRVRVERAGGGVAVLRDSTTGAQRTVRARVVVNATGVWAGGLAPGVRLRPSRGSHLVLRRGALPGSCAVMAPVPGSSHRFVFALPQPDGTSYLGLTDEPVDRLEDVPTVPDTDVAHLLDVLGRVLERPLSRDDVVGAFAGLRPLVESGAARSADLSRRHVVRHDDGVVTVVGGKLTTYRRMAQDAVDLAVACAGLVAGPCRTRTLPLVGAAPREELARLAAAGTPDRLLRRYGAEAAEVLTAARAATGLDDEELLAPVAPDLPVTLAELVFGATHEGARDEADLLERRTRVALVEADVTRATPLAARALALAGVPLTRG